MLPLALICLLQAQLILAQSLLALDEVHEFPLGSPAIFAIPPFPSNLSVSVAICSSSSSFPRFFFSNDSSKRVASPNDAEGEGYTEMILQDGFAEWTGGFREGGYLAVTNTGQTPFEIGLSQNGAWCIRTTTQCPDRFLSNIYQQVPCTISPKAYHCLVTRQITKLYSFPLPCFQHRLQTPLSTQTTRCP